MNELHELMNVIHEWIYIYIWNVSVTDIFIFEER